MREVFSYEAGPAVAAVALDRPIVAVARCLLGHDEGYRTSQTLARRVTSNLVTQANGGSSVVESMDFILSKYSEWKAALGIEAEEAHVVASMGVRHSNEWWFAHVGNCEAIAISGGIAKRVIHPHTLWDDQYPSYEPESIEDMSAAEVASRAIGWGDSKIASSRIDCTGDEVIVMTSIPVFRQVDRKLSANPLEAYIRVKEHIARWAEGQSLVVYWESSLENR